MNILPKKTWHVLRKENVERVRKDEKLAAERQREQERRAEFAESEFYLDTLKRRAAGSTSASGNSDSVSSRIADTIAPEKASNAEYEREKQEDQEKLEKRIGLLTYLVDKDAKRSTDHTWYLKRAAEDGKDVDDSEFDVKKKTRLDPLSDMRRYERIIEKHREMRHDQTKLPGPSRATFRNVSSSTNPVSVQELRRARLEREQAERRREEELKKRLSSESAVSKPAVIDERQLRFNSQFNPDLARQNRPSSSKSSAHTS